MTRAGGMVSLAGKRGTFLGMVSLKVRSRNAPVARGDTLAFASGVVLLVTVVASVFWQTRSFGILNFDDDQYLDPLVLQGLTWPGFVRAWTQEHVGNWHPLTTLSFMLDAELFGQWWGGYHLHNAVLHAAASACLFAAFTRLTGAMGRSLVAAAVFAIHPLRVESVAWITERKDVLSGLFLATTLLAYAFFVEQPQSRRRYAILLVSFAAGLLSKSMLVTLPVALLILDWWPLRRLADSAWAGSAGPGAEWERHNLPRRTLRQLVVEKLPLLGLAAASAVATVLSVGDVVRPITTLPFPVRAASSVVAYASYVGQLFWPVGLAPHYPYSSTGPTAVQVAASAVLVGGLTAAAWAARRGWPAFTVGWAWFLVTLLPVIGFIPSGIQLIADRYTYVSQIWLIVAVVWGLADLVERLRIPKGLAWAASLVALLGLAWGSWLQARHWSDSESLWRYTLSVTDANAYAHANLASVLAQRGEPVEAAEHNRKALAIESDNLMALSNLATLLIERGGGAEAIRLYERAVELNPKFVFGWFNLGGALLKGGRTSEAEAAWRRCVELNPGMAAAWSQLATLLLDRGDAAAAAELAERAVAAGGGLEACLALGQALDSQGKVEEAVAAYRRAVAANPASTLALNNLGSTLERTGRLDEAAAVLRRAIKLEPGAAVLLFNQGLVLEKMGSRDDAAAALRAAEQAFRAAGNAAMAKAAAERATALGGGPASPAASQ
jgi:tetratricopeptide (TPR) repeat protein